ncbi:MAG TPA: phytanoyl-CoA dioxygenase family protein [Chthonomonadaceae bacterium]|nr:phytanoyl-CoA dioxygenase family protein [Chthonomonadaceae bacterium]
MTTSSPVTAKRQQLLTDGYCLFENVLDRPMLDELTIVTERLLAEVSEADAERFRYQGSNISVAYQDPVFPRLFAWPRALEALRELGFDHPKWWSAFLLSKPPHAPPLYWHQDWWGWQDPVSAEVVPQQLFLMYYLTDTRPENGCLRVLPGTQLRRHALHDLLPDAHTEATYFAPLESPLFTDPPEARDLPVQAGDLVIGDARVLHAAHANATDQRRTLLTLWYFPTFDTLPEPIRAFVARHRSQPPPDFPHGEEWSRLEPLIPTYSGTAEPIPFDRKPGVYLRQ